MLEGLTKRGPGFNLGRFSPEQTSQFFASVRSRLEGHEGQQRQLLGAQPGRSGSLVL